MDRLRVALLFGGASEEHAISLKSAEEVAKRASIPTGMNQYSSGFQHTATGSCVTVLMQTGKTVAAFQRRCHLTDACKVSWSKCTAVTNRSPWIWCFRFCTGKAARMGPSKAC